jgi:hypothetical protein
MGGDGKGVTVYRVCLGLLACTRGITCVKVTRLYIPATDFGIYRCRTSDHESRRIEIAIELIDIYLHQIPE